MDTMLIVLLSAVVALIGVTFGGKIQKTARFIYPVDFMTLSLIVIAFVVCISGYMPIDCFWLLPFFAGYIVGYLIVGRTVYVMVTSESLGQTFFQGEAWVTYNMNDKIYIQDQNNRALFNRLVFHVHHELIVDGPFEPNWNMSIKFPLFPLFKVPFIRTEWYRTTCETVKASRFHHYRQFKTEAYIVYANQVSKAQLLQDENALEDLQNQNTELVFEVSDLKRAQGPKLTECAMRTIIKATDKTKPNRMYTLLEEQKARSRTKKETQPEQQEVIEDADKDDDSETEQ